MRGLKLNTGSKVQPHHCWVQGYDHCPSPADHTVSDTSHDSMVVHVSSRNELKIWKKYDFYGILQTDGHEPMFFLLQFHLPLFHYLAVNSKCNLSSSWKQLWQQRFSSPLHCSVRSQHIFGVWLGAIFPNSHVGWVSFFWTCQQNKVENCLHVLCWGLPAMKIKLYNWGPLQNCSRDQLNSQRSSTTFLLSILPSKNIRYSQATCAWCFPSAFEGACLHTVKVWFGVDETRKVI